MDCKAFEQRLDALIDGLLPPGQVQELRRHAESCPACARRLAEAEELAALLRGLDETEPPADLHERIMSALPEGRPGGAHGRIVPFVRTRAFRVLTRGAAVCAAAAVVTLGLRTLMPSMTQKSESNCSAPMMMVAADTSAPEVRTELGAAQDDGLAPATGGAQKAEALVEERAETTSEENKSMDGAVGGGMFYVTEAAENAESEKTAVNALPADMLADGAAAEPQTESPQACVGTATVWYGGADWSGSAQQADRLLAEAPVGVEARKTETDGRTVWLLVCPQEDGMTEAVRTLLTERGFTCGGECAQFAEADAEVFVLETP